MYCGEKWVLEGKICTAEGEIFTKGERDVLERDLYGEQGSVLGVEEICTGEKSLLGQR